MVLLMLASVVLVVNPASTHQTGSHTVGTTTPDVTSVERCATFEWAEKKECGRYDTTNHHWKVTNNCPRSVKVMWADNAYEGIGSGKPIERHTESGKPILEKATTIKPGKTKKGDVGCVDKAQIEICIAYLYPPINEHAEVDCDDFFHHEP